MSYVTSRHLNQRQLHTITTIGDMFVPAAHSFPSFSESGCLFHIDTALAPTPADDLKQLKLVLTLMSFLPQKVLHWLLQKLDVGECMPAWADFIGAQLRLLLFGLRGIIFSLYYSGQGNPYQPNRVFEVMDYHVSCQPDTPDQATAISTKATLTKTIPEQ